MKKVWIGLTATALSLSMVLAGCGGAASQNGASGGGASQPPAAQAPEAKAPAGNKFLTIATGGSSGVYYVIGGALAKAYNSKLGYNASAQSTSASVENINLVNAKKVDLAIIQSDVAADAIAGRFNFEKGGPVQNLQTLGAMHLSFIQVVAPKKNNIKSISDLKGKKISVGAPNSGVEINARALLTAYGLTYDDVKVDYLSFSESVDQIKNGTLDAAFITTGLGVAAILDLQTTVDIDLVPIPASDITKLQEQNSAFFSAEIPAGTYKNDKPVPTVAMKNIMLVRSDMSEDEAYQLTKTFYESKDELTSAHNAAKEINVDTASKDVVVPLHPGAAKYFKEIGKN